MTGKTKPIQTVKLGKLRAGIWENHSTKGKLFYTVTLYRIYKGQDGKWNQSPSFGRDDLHDLCKIAVLAWAEIEKLT